MRRVKSTCSLLFVSLLPPPPAHCARESLNHLPVRWKVRVSTRWPCRCSSSSGYSCWDRGPGLGPRHTLSLLCWLAGYSVRTLPPQAWGFGLRSPFLVPWSWTIIRNAWNELILLQEEFYLARSRRKPHGDHNESSFMEKSSETSQGCFRSVQFSQQTKPLGWFLPGCCAIDRQTWGALALGRDLLWWQIPRFYG